MVSSELDTIKAAAGNDRRARLLGLLVGIVAAVLLMSSRLTPVFLFSMLLIWGALSRDRVKQALPEWNGATAAIAGFLGYGLLSTLWAASFGSGLVIALTATAVAATGIVLSRLVWLEDRPSILRISQALWIGYLVGLIYFFIEIKSAQAVKIWVYNTLHVSPELLQPKRFHKWVDGELVKIARTTLTRIAAPTTPMLWPALMAVLGGVARPWNRWVAFALYLVALVVIFHSPHESSKLAAVLGSLAFAVALWSRRWSANLLRAAWVFACLGVLPAAFLAHKLDLHNAKWLQMSAQHRIIIWNFTAEQVLKSPVFGTGIYTTYKKGPEITRQAVNEPGERHKRKMSRHSHNVYLQTWYEFGVIGALLLMAVGLMLIDRIVRLEDRLQPFAFAAFASTAALMGSSYGMWQAWFMALFALTPVFFAIGGRALETSEK